MNYRASSALGSTDLKNLLDSPRVFLDGRQNPREPSSSMVIGTLSHVLLLEPELFEEKYVVCDATTRNTKKFKDLKGENPNKEIILEKEVERALITIKEFSEAPALEKCAKEEECFAETEVGGQKIKLKALFDAVDLKRHIIFDFKTIRDVDAWDYNLEKYKYYLQEYHYRYVYSLANNIPIEHVRFVFMVADTSTGYSFITQLDDQTQIAAEAEHKKALMILKSFMDAKKLSQDEIINFPAEKEPAFNLKKIKKSGLKLYAINKILNTTLEGE